MNMGLVVVIGHAEAGEEVCMCREVSSMQR